jgi:hypothetical protein
VAQCLDGGLVDANYILDYFFVHTPLPLARQ